MFIDQFLLSKNVQAFAMMPCILFVLLLRVFTDYFLDVCKFH